MANFESVEELIRAARNGRSQKEFADLLEVDQSMVSKYERGVGARLKVPSDAR